MTVTNSTTKLRALLDEQERTAAWLGRQLGVHRTTAADWVSGSEAVPAPRRGQILVILGWHSPTQGKLFDADGFALPKGD